ncbi:MAG: translation initiation factor IF-2 subunit beta [Nanoarchaeota archaeon]
MDYESLLDNAYEKLPETQEEKERFEIPKVRGHIQGNKTVVTNFHQIAQFLNRSVDHLLKYVLKELATPGTKMKNGIIFGTKIPASRINEKIEKYVEEFVLCKECKKPDTKLVKEDKYLFKKCMACGARHSVRILK